MNCKSLETMASTSFFEVACSNCNFLAFPFVHNSFIYLSIYAVGGDPSCFLKHTHTSHIKHQQYCPPLIWYVAHCMHQPPRAGNWAYAPFTSIPLSCMLLPNTAFGTIKSKRNRKQNKKQEHVVPARIELTHDAKSWTLK
jgi:hypothetical protein